MFVLVVLVVEVCSFTAWREGKGEQEATRDEMQVLENKRLDIRATWVVLRPQSLSWCKSFTFPALAWEECAASGTSQEFLLDCTLSGPSSLPLLLPPFEWVLGSSCSYSACSSALVPAVHVVTLACVNVALSAESRSHEEGTEQ